jgi:hypothetical protein
MGTRYNINDLVVYKGDKTYLVVDIEDPESSSPTYILEDSANGTRRAKASELNKKGSKKKFPGSKFEIGDTVEMKGEGFGDDRTGTVIDVHDTHGWADYEYEVEFNTGLPETPNNTDIIPEMDLKSFNPVSIPNPSDRN